MTPILGWYGKGAESCGLKSMALQHCELTTVLQFGKLEELVRTDC